MDHRIVFIAVGVALLAVVGYLLVMRVFYRESKELDKHIDDQLAQITQGQTP